MALGAHIWLYMTETDFSEKNSIGQNDKKWSEMTQSPRVFYFL